MATTFPNPQPLETTRRRATWLSLTEAVLVLAIIKLAVLPLLSGYDVWPHLPWPFNPIPESGTTKYLFVFGDSYTTTGFNIKLDKPSASNPLGNPPLPGKTFSGGLSWPGFLATKFNTSLTLTYVFAVGGATVDDTIFDEPAFWPVPSVSDQVETWALNIQSKPTYAPWTAENALFAVWIGINDIGRTWSRRSPLEEEVMLSRVLDRLFVILHDLYSRGARKFALLGIPPMQKVPFDKNRLDLAPLMAAITFWNSQLQARMVAFQQANPRATVYLVDTQNTFNTVLSNPERYGAPNADCANRDGKSCLWWDGYHPGIAIQEMVAQTVAQALKGSFFQTTQPMVPL